MIGLLSLVIPIKSSYSAVNESLLDEIQHRAFLFLWDEVNPKNGLVKDRAGNFKSDNYRVASIASSGFALASIPVAIERQWISKKSGRERVLTTLKFFVERAPQKKGFFYHFYGMNSEQRAWKSELSSIDTGLLLAGALVAREYFEDSQITRLVNILYERMDFEWMMNDGLTLTMGWKPKTGFLKSRWSGYDEGIMLTLLAIGSDTHSIPSETWNHIRRRKGVYDSIVVVQSPPLFTHQYPQLFFDLRNKHDKYMDYYSNSVNATRANQLFCANSREKFETYREGYWGLTACDGPGGYKAYGAEPGGALSDGTVAPTAALTSIMFTPEASLDFLTRLYNNEKDWLWGRYGFTDSFNFKKKWRSNDVIGIDQGAIILGIENYRSELIWKLFNRAPEVKRALKLTGFKRGSRPIRLPQAPQISVPQVGEETNWSEIEAIQLSHIRNLEMGSIDSREDLDADIKFAWDKRHLYFRFRASDDSHHAPHKNSQIWKNDCLELFVDPSGGGLVWGNPRHFQIGFSSSEKEKGKLLSWAWFQGKDPLKNHWIDAKVISNDDGSYEIHGRIKWTYLNITPRKGKTVNLSPAFHDLDEDGEEKKFNWHFLSKNGRFELGKLVLK